MKNKKFTKDDLKVGYVVVCNDEPHMVMISQFNELLLVSKNHGFLYLKTYTDDLRDPNVRRGMTDWTITEVYGYSDRYGMACDISTRGRPLLWKREDPKKKMTVEEIEEKLGYKIEIISGEDKK